MEIGEQVALSRRLELLQPVTVTVVTAAELAKRVMESFEEEAEEDPEAYRFAELLYRNFGIIGPSDSYLDEVTELYGDQVVAYYDNELEEIVTVAGDTLEGTQLVTLRHEYIHALQDQHFDLDNLFDNAVGDDAVKAVQAFVEGDAEIFSLDSFIGTPSQWSQLHNNTPLIRDSSVARLNSRSGGTPLVIFLDLAFPYIAGLRFVALGGLEDGYKGVNSIFDDPPQSTEQIIYPQKYFGEVRDDPVIVHPSASNYGGWMATETSTLGLFWINNWLSQLSGEWANRSALDGWGGDLLEVLDNPDTPAQTVLKLTVAWDEPATDSAEFGAAFRQAFKTADAFGAGGCPGKTDIWSGPGGVVSYRVTDSQESELVFAPDCEVLRKITDDG